MTNRDSAKEKKQASEHDDGVLERLAHALGVWGALGSALIPSESNVGRKARESAASRHWVGQLAGVLAKWGLLGSDLVRSPTEVDWRPAQLMVEAMREWGETQKKAYQAVLEKSGAQLAPFGDPLRVDFGTHRWLRKGHEESYSAWLAWIIEQLETPWEVFRLFKLRAQDEVISECGGATLQVQAEKTIEVPDGSGRLDIVVEYQREQGEKVALIVVEVKRGTPAEGELDRQLTAYGAWVDRQTAYEQDRRFRVLLSSEDDESKLLPGAFIPVPWKHVCLGLRRLAPRYVPGRPTVAAMILGFVGAVEQNLLHMSLPGIDEPATTWVGREAVFSHIRATLETGERK